MAAQIITRFAPSPTGALHIGGVRTALYNWLLAQRMRGHCILRIENTDAERSTQASEQQILDSFTWLGMEFGSVYRQSERADLYDQAAERLMQAGHVYVCACSPERLTSLREQQMAAKHKPRYDGRCRAKGLQWEPGRVLRMVTPTQGTVVFTDKVHGSIQVQNAELDDMIIRRSDGSYTYNFCCVVDDSAMGVSTVIRGDDHINNTPRQIHLYQLLGYKVPEFAHLPMILGADGKRLSKRHGAQGVLDYADQGFVPDALLNFLVRLGWSYGDQEVFTREQLTQRFSLDRVSKSPSIFNETKLLWLNKQHIKNMPVAQLLPMVRQRAPNITLSDADLMQLIAVLQQRVGTTVALVEALAPYTQEQFTIDPAATSYVNQAALPVLMRAYDCYTKANWDEADLQQIAQDIAKELEVGMGKVGMPLRVAVTGQGFSPSLDVTFKLLGKDTVLARIAKAIQSIRY